MFKKTFLKLSLQKCLDKLYSQCCKIFKVYLTNPDSNAKLLLLIFFECSYFLRTSLWRKSLSFWLNCEIITCDFFECSYFLRISLWLKSLSHKSSIDLQKKIKKACLYVIEICVSYCAIELEWIGIWSLYYIKKEVFSYKFCEFLHNDGFETFCELFYKFLDDWF